MRSPRRIAPETLELVAAAGFAGAAGGCRWWLIARWVAAPFSGNPLCSLPAAARGGRHRRHFLSVAVVPTRDADNMSIYAAPVPWLALPPCSLMLVITSRLRNNPTEAQMVLATESARPALSLFASMAGTLFLLPLLFRFGWPLAPSVRFAESDVLDWQPRHGSQLPITEHDSPTGYAAGSLTAGLTAWTTPLLRTYDRAGIVLVCGTSSNAGLLILDARHAMSGTAAKIKGTWVRPILGHSPFSSRLHCCHRPLHPSRIFPSRFHLPLRLRVPPLLK